MANLLERELCITFNREAMLEALATAGSIVAAKSPKPILQNIKLIAHPENGTEILATDLEIGIRQRVLGVEVEAPVALILSPVQFGRILKNADDDSAYITVDEDAVTVRGRKWKFKLPTEDPALFPEVPVFEAANYHVCSAADLRRMIARTRFATDVESTRYALGGTLLEASEDTLTMVGTDGRQLARQVVAAEVEGTGLSRKSSVVIPVKALKLIERSVKDDDPPVHIANDPSSVLIRTDRAVIYSRLVEGRYPKYQDVFPKEFKTVVTVQAGDLLAGCEQVAITTSEESRGVDVEFGKEALKMSSQAADVGNGDTELEISLVSGEPVAATLDVRYLIEALKPLDRSTVIRWELIDAKNALICKTEDRFSYCIMPLTRDR